MFMSNPFAELSALIPVVVMQGYLIVMVLLVVGGTILDMMHKKSAKYFFLNAEKAKKSAKREVGAGEISGMALDYHFLQLWSCRNGSCDECSQ